MQNINNNTRIEILATIDELYQYLNGYVTKTSLQKTVRSFKKKPPTDLKSGGTSHKIEIYAIS